ncbi:TPA: hypothetical protein JBB31_10315 [Legionella pneumophila subsp. pneumophila]|uniref:Uncharacterized protein n=1 Tax=Legionella pneumophila TaxID=446 RepID=A0AAN5TBB3_LEGPN|nr:hypothetical protein DI137_13505 [Legionella pneumophila]HAT8831171.1 hypothetical protein [Legionella pneumophila subsp. pneumophila]HAT7005546.1 hypothetical protein [Legionella pneumophila]HAT7744227.1 hypothetical protein [Legionella pneumophila]HAT7938518.1 hypothetical protein [Legionella pneumophila]
MIFILLVLYFTFNRIQVIELHFQNLSFNKKLILWLIEINASYYKRISVITIFEYGT